VSDAHEAGVEAGSVLKKMILDVHIIVFTMFDDALGSRLSSAVGVDLVVPKAEGLTSLLKTVQHFMGTAGLIKSTARQIAASRARRLIHRNAACPRRIVVFHESLVRGVIDLIGGV